MKRLFRAIVGPSFVWYVAWRYLLARPRRLSGILFGVLLFFVFAFSALLLAVPLQALTFQYLDSPVVLAPWETVVLGVAALVVPFGFVGTIVRRFIFQRPAKWLPIVTALVVAAGMAALSWNGRPMLVKAFSPDTARLIVWLLPVVLFGVAAFQAARPYRFARLCVVVATGLGAWAAWLFIALSGLTFKVDLPPPIWLTFALIAGGLLIVFTIVFLVIRYFFTFFSTVSIGGVLIGGAALVMVLSIMSGFENHLRSRILGSNAHLLVSRAEKGPFTEYREVSRQIGETPTVTGHSPYLQSEIVIAGKNAYDSAIIKGVDPQSIGKVTELGKNLDDEGAIDRLWPLNPDGEPMRRASGAGGGTAPMPSSLPDPAPDDMALPEEEPVDLSAKRRGAVKDPAPDDMQLPDEDRPEDFSGDEVHLARIPDSAGKRVAENEAEILALPGVLIGRELGDKINLYEGQEVRLVSPFAEDTPIGQVPRTKRARVAGRFFTGMYQYDLKYVYIELGALQEFLDLGDQVHGIEIRIADPDRTTPVKAHLKKVLGPDYKVQDWKEINRSLFSALKIEKMAMFLILVVIILVASFSIMGTLIMTVYEKGREISILKTLGASLPEIVRVFVVQGFGIGFLGIFVGVGLGLLACWLNVTVGVRIPADVYYMDRLPTHVEPVAVTSIALAGLIISVLATIYPAYLAARMDVVAGLRKE
jgi:lipoprotein-releasing system permease protein